MAEAARRQHGVDRFGYALGFALAVVGACGDATDLRTEAAKLRTAQAVVVECPSPPAEITRYALRADLRVDLGTKASVEGGDVAVARATAGACPGPGCASIGTQATVSQARKVVAAAVALSPHATIGPVATNRLDDNGGTHGAVTPFPGGLPTPPTTIPPAIGTVSFEVPSKEARSLAPGRYAAIRVRNKARLSLGPGLYEAARIEIDNHAVVEALPGTELRIGKLTVGSGAALRPGGDAGAKGLLVAISQASVEACPSMPELLFSLGEGAEVRALVVQRVGSARLSPHAVLRGALAAPEIFLQPSSKVVWEDGLAGDGRPQPLDDGNPCTIDSCDPAVGAVHVPVANGTSCANANQCDGAETCQAGLCTPGSAVVCTAADACHEAGTCDPATGGCSSPTRPDGTGCDDANACTRADACRSGVCEGADPVVCSAADACHEPGTCDPATGSCSVVVAASGKPCDDGNACTQEDRCDAGVCQPGTPVVCTALDACHVVGTCDPATGTCSQPPAPDGIACNDGNGCTRSDTCQAGACVGGDPVACAALDQCHDVGTCDPGSGRCSNPQKTDGSSCSDGNACSTVDVCRNGQCQGEGPVACVALDQCHDPGVCNPLTGVCSNPPRADGTTCNDGSACTRVDTCVGGSCVGGDLVACTARDACHTVGVCDPTTGTCSEPAKPDETVCDDGSACSRRDVCRGGVCTGEDLVACVARDQCHVAGACDPATGLCSDPQKANDTPCDDGNACTKVDGCQAGTCVGAQPVTCVPLDACHVSGACDPATGACSNPAAADGTGCNDGDACTQVDACAGGACVGGQTVSCPPATCAQVFACNRTTGACEASPNPDINLCRDRGMVLGRVLSDATGLPLPGAYVAVGGDSVATGESGRYRWPTADAALDVRIEKPGYTTAYRRVEVEHGVGSFASDARLTRLADASPMGPEGGSRELALSRWGRDPVSLRLDVAPGALGEGDGLRLTALSAQGLPAPLPRGWGPLAAFDLRTDAGVSALGATTGQVTGLKPGTVVLARFDVATLSWRAEAVRTVDAGETQVPIGRAGAFVFAVPDGDAAPVVAPVGEALTGVDVAAVIGSAAAAAEPRVLPATGGVVEARVVVPGNVSAPSGTVIQLSVRDSFELKAGMKTSSAPRLEDLVLYRTQVPPVEGVPASLGASFPVVPSRTYTPASLTRGNIHIDVFGVRAEHHGKLGGREAVLVEDVGVTLEIPAGARSEQTLVEIARARTEDFVFAASGAWTPVAQVEVDFGGAEMGIGGELSIRDVTVADGASLVLAHVVRVEGVAHPVPVALGERRGDEWAFPAGGELHGVRAEGAYVVFQVTGDVGLVAGKTLVSGAPVRALVNATGTPLASLSALDGRYVLVLPVGAAALRGSVAGTNLSGSGTAAIEAGAAATLDIELFGAVTTAVVVPEHGAVAVPQNTQVDVTTTAPLDPDSVVPDNVKLLKGDVETGTEVASRLVLSGDALGLAVIPEVQFEPATTYTLVAAGLRDVFGGVVTVPVSSFKTKFDVPPVYDTGRITFGMPDANGMVGISVPPGALPPGTQILVTNEGNGIVVSYTVGNDGSLSEELPGSIDDVLRVSVIDPFGNVTSFSRSQFQGTDGSVAVGPGGGVVKGEGGVELRIPEGALDKGATFKLTLVANEAFVGVPELPDGTIAGGLRIESSGALQFRKEVDVAFPRPPGAPDGAFYYVYREVRSDSQTPLAGGGAFEVVDHAFVEGAGPDARVVTASCPFRGFLDVADGLGEILEVSKRVSRGPVGAPLRMSMLMLAYTNDLLAPKLAGPAMIRGRIVRPVWKPGSPVPEYEGVRGWIVSGADATGQPLLTSPNHALNPQQFAVSQDDGLFTLWDPFPSRGEVRLVANAQWPLQACPAGGPTDTAACVTATQNIVLPDACADNTKYYRNILKANIVLPAAQVPPAPTSPLVIKVWRVVEGVRLPSDGVVTAGQPLVVTFSAQAAQVTAVEVTHGPQKESLSVRPDPQAGQATGGDQMAELTPSEATTYTVAARALPLPAGPAFTATSAFRVVAAGGDITTPVPDVAPAVIAARSVPSDGSDGVPTQVAPHVVFTEPVRGVPGQVVLTEVDTSISVAVSLTGVDTTGAPRSLDGPDGPAIAITSLTIQPKRQLKFAAKYRLSLQGGIYDLDNTLPDGPGAGRTLVPYEITFSTVEAKALMPPGDGFSSAGIAAVGDYAYVVENNFTYGMLRAFDVSNPADPVEMVDAQKRMLGRPMGIDAQQDGDTENAKIVVATGPADTSLPSNLRIYRAKPTPTTNAQGQTSTTVETEWIGAATLSASAVEGIVQRVVVKGNFAYAVTTQKGVQVVDLDFAERLFANAGGDVSGVRVPLNTDGMGFGHESVVSTVPVMRANGRPAFLADLKVAELNDGFRQPIVVAVGDIGIVLLNPQTGEVLPERPLESRGFRGRAVDVARVMGRDVAVVVGDQNGVSSLIVLDIADPRSPTITSEVVLVGRPIDVEVRDGLALVGTDLASSLTVVLNVEDITRAFDVGRIFDLAGRLSVTASGAIVANMPTSAGGNVALGGVRTATLGILPSIGQVLPLSARFVGSATTRAVETLADVHLPVLVFAAPSSLLVAEIVVAAEGGVYGTRVLHTLPAALTHQTGIAHGDVILPAGTRVEDGERLTAEPRAPLPSGPVSGPRRRLSTAPMFIRIHASDNETYHVPSLRPGAQVQHFVSAQGQGDIVLEAVNAPDPNRVTWHVRANEVAPAGVSPPLPLVRTLDGRSAAIWSSNTQGMMNGSSSPIGLKIPIDVRFGAQPVANCTVWVVWARGITRGIVPRSEYSAGRLHVWVDAHFEFSIEPREIVSSTGDPEDVPNLAGPALGATVAEPPVVPDSVQERQVVRDPDHHVLDTATNWDVTRQHRRHEFRFGSQVLETRFPSELASLPDGDLIGNDDAGGGGRDERNDPYLGQDAKLESFDCPGFPAITSELRRTFGSGCGPRSVDQAFGTMLPIGSFATYKMQFKEFARLSVYGVNKTPRWFRISDDIYWRHHFGVELVDEGQSDLNDNGQSGDKVWILSPSVPRRADEGSHAEY